MSRHHIAILIALLALPVPGQLPLRHESFGSSPFGAFGMAIGRIADRDGDGVDDLLVGSPTVDRVSILSGRTGAVLSVIVAPIPFENFGRAVAGLDDLNGDGIEEIAVGAPLHDGNGSDCGRLLVYSGADLSILHSFLGDFAGDEFGSAVIGWDDLDGDGAGEILVGAAGQLSNGYARLHSSSGAPLSSFFGSTPGGGTGSALARVPDLDGDGLAEIAVGSPWADGPSGLARGRLQVIAGNGQSFLVDLEGSAMGASLGLSVAVPGDVDGDGAADVLVGAPGDDGAGPDAGAAYLLSGATGTVIRTHQGSQSFALFGQSVAAIGDADGDGIGDYAIGAWFEDGLHVDSGALRVYSGLSGQLVLERKDAATGAHLGAAVGAIGDVDGDGFAEVAVSAPDSSAGALLAGELRVYSAGGFRPYDSVLAPAAMTLSWIPGVAGGLTQGTLQVNGGTVAGAGLIAVSLARADLDYGFLSVLVNPDPNLLLLESFFGHDATGSASFPTSLNQPFLAGFTIYLQAFDLTFPYAATNGLEMLPLP